MRGCQPFPSRPHRPDRLIPSSLNETTLNGSVTLLSAHCPIWFVCVLSSKTLSSSNPLFFSAQAQVTSVISTRPFFIQLPQLLFIEKNMIIPASTLTMLESAGPAVDSQSLEGRFKKKKKGRERHAFQITDYNYKTEALENNFPCSVAGKGCVIHRLHWLLRPDCNSLSQTRTIWYMSNLLPCSGNTPQLGVNPSTAPAPCAWVFQSMHSQSTVM